MSKLMDFAPIALKNLFSKPATKNYPAAPIEFPERSRGHIVNNFDDCILCGICQKKCPSSAITVDRVNKTWSIDRMGCVQCANCVNGCPKHCLDIQPGYTEPDYTKTVDTLQKPVEETKAEKKLVNSMDDCIFCGICKRQCPNDALEVDRAEKVWKVNDEKCVKCGLCVEKCPKKVLSITEQEEVHTEKGSLTNDISSCVLCGICQKQCPNEAIIVDRKETKTWSVNLDNCVQCGLCTEKCPKKSLSFTGKGEGTVTFTKE